MEPGDEAIDFHSAHIKLVGGSGCGCSGLFYLLSGYSYSYIIVYVSIHCLDACRRFYGVITNVFH